MATNSKGASSGWSSELEVTIAAGIIPDQIGVLPNGGLYFNANGDGYWTTGDTMDGLEPPETCLWQGIGTETAKMRSLYSEMADGTSMPMATDTGLRVTPRAGSEPPAICQPQETGTETAKTRLPCSEMADGTSMPMVMDTGLRVTPQDGSERPATCLLLGTGTGDGKDEIAVFRNGGWYFDANGEGYWTTGDTTGWFGATGDLPAAGDWDGDGKDEIAVFRNGGWYFDANGDRYWTTGDTTGWFGAGGDRPVAGRWGLLSFLALDQDKPQVALNEQPAEKIRQKKAALEELQEERRNQISEIKLRAATPS